VFLEVPIVIPNLPKWDLSLESLQEVSTYNVTLYPLTSLWILVVLQIVLGIENDGYRNDKLKLLNQLLNSLSFPPLPIQKTTPRQIWYVTHMYMALLGIVFLYTYIL